MPMPRTTTRRWIFAVAALALLIAPPAWLARQLVRALDEHYGPDGSITREFEFSAGSGAALDLVRAGRFAEAEAAYRALAPLAGRLRARGLSDRGWSQPNRVGLAASIAGQGRHAEAEPLFRAELGRSEDDRPAPAVEQLGWYAATLRALGRADAAAAVDARAAAVRPGASGAAPVTSP